MNQSNLEDNYNENVSSLDPLVLNLFGLLLSLIAIICFLSNSFLIFTFIRHKDLRSPLNIFIVAISLSNLLSTLQFPFLIKSNFDHRWSFSMLTCQLNGFLMYFVGCMHTFLMTAISVERYYVVEKPMVAKHFKPKLMIKIVMVCVFISLFWSAMPLLGWSHYSFEASRTGCCVEYREKSFSIFSYNLAMFVFVFALPFGFILASNIRLLFLIKRMVAILSRMINSKYYKMVLVQRKITLMMFIYISGFLITWTPFAIVILYSAFINTDQISPLVAAVSSLFCKFSTVWSTLFYLFSDRNIKSKLSSSFQLQSIQKNSKVKALLVGKKKRVQVTEL